MNILWEINHISGFRINKLWDSRQQAMGKRSSLDFNYPSVDNFHIFPVDEYCDSLQFLFSLSLWVDNNLPMGIEMDTQAALLESSRII